MFTFIILNGEQKVKNFFYFFENFFALQDEAGSSQDVTAKFCKILRMKVRL